MLAGAGGRWVTSFQVETSTDGAAFSRVDGGFAFHGNADDGTELEIHFRNPVVARYVRVMVAQFLRRGGLTSSSE